MELRNQDMTETTMFVWLCSLKGGSRYTKYSSVVNTGNVLFKGCGL